MSLLRRRRVCLTLLAAVCMMFTLQMTISFQRLLEQYAGQVVILSVEDPVIAFVNNDKDKKSNVTRIAPPNIEYNFNAAFVNLLARKFRMRSMCLKDYQAINVDENEYLKHIAVNDNKQILVCAMKDVQNLAMFQAFVNQNANDGQGDRVVEKVKYLNTFEPSQQRRMLQNYTKIVIVENPLERLALSYRNKFKLSTRQRRQDSYENLVEFYKRYSHLSNSSKTLQEYAQNPLSFKEYLAYWVDRVNIRENQEEQFMTYRDICRPCATSYEYVIHAEDSEETILAIAKKLNVVITQSMILAGDKRSHEERLTKLSSSISKDLFSKVWEIVCSDSVMFGFTNDGHNCTVG